MTTTTTTVFGTLPSGEEISRIQFDSPSGKFRAAIISFGATLQSFQERCNPSTNAAGWDELTLSYGTLNEYVSGPGGHLGGTCGRFAGRISGATFPSEVLLPKPSQDRASTSFLETASKAGTAAKISLPKNNNDKHTLHGGPTGYSLRPWKIEPIIGKRQRTNVSSSSSSTINNEGEMNKATNVKKKEEEEEEEDFVVGVCCKLHSPDGDNGFPSSLDVVARYFFDTNKDEALIMELSAKNTGSTATVCNLTNHAYWNLGGGGGSGKTAKPITDHTIHAPNARHFLPVDNFVIPTGEIASVAGTALDFLSAPRAIGERIGAPLLTPAPPAKPGYDHCLVLSGSRLPEGWMRHAATLADPNTGRSMIVETTAPAVVLYSGNFLERQRNGVGFDARSGVCLECQGFPDSPNHPGTFPPAVVQVGEMWHQVTKHTFSSTTAAAASFAAQK